jgi:flagellar basal-body rod modification protein FlgD
VTTTSSLSSLYNNASSSTLASTSTETASQLKNEFLQLLLTELKNQDPTQPVDSTAMISQQAQFASLEQMQNLNTNLVSLMAMDAISQANTLIGKTVTGTDTSGNAVSGTVDSVKYSSGNPYLIVGSSTVSPSDVTAVQ